MTLALMKRVRLHTLGLLYFEILPAQEFDGSNTPPKRDGVSYLVSSVKFKQYYQRARYTPELRSNSSHAAFKDRFEARKHSLVGPFNPHSRTHPS